MEKIIIKPTSKELVFKNDEPGTFFDAFSYNGSNLQEKNLGSLFVVGQVKYGEENLGYLVNLISSLAKREYYANAFSPEISSKVAFENTLKKLNEVLEDFFKNKTFKLSIGLASIANDNIYISRIGNLKVSLARNGDHIDVLNNIELFDKAHIEEKEFSNIISGKLQQQDKLFMYLPIKSVTSREKSIRGVFKNQPQAVFTQKIEDLSKTANNFACCGIHVSIGSVKEIPVATRPSYYSYQPATLTSDESDDEVPAPVVKKVEQPEDKEEKEEKEDDTISNNDDLKAYKDLPKPHIIPADVSLIKRKTPIASLTNFFGNVSSGPFIKRGASRKKILLISLAALIAVGGISYGATIWSRTPASVSQVNDNIKLVQEKISQNDYRGARSLLAASIGLISAENTGKAQAARESLDQIASSLDKVSDKLPVILWDLSSQEKKINNVVFSSNGVYALDAEGNLYTVDNGSLKNFTKLGITSAQFTFDGSKDALLLNNDARGSIVNKTNAKNADYSLDGISSLQHAAIYEDNLYALSEGSIIKFADAALGKTTGTSWSKDKLETAQSIAADGNIYILTNDGKLLTYFVGERKTEFDLNLTPSSDATIYAHKDLPFVYLIDKTSKKVMIFDKANGSLQVTYSLSNVGTVREVSIAKDQTISILSDDNKIWQIK